MSNQPNWTAYFKLDRLAMSLDTHRGLLFTISKKYAMLNVIAYPGKKKLLFIYWFCCCCCFWVFRKSVMAKSCRDDHSLLLCKNSFKCFFDNFPFQHQRHALLAWQYEKPMKCSVPRKFSFNQLLLYLSYLFLYLSFQTSRRKQDQENPRPFSGIPCNTWGVVS